MSNGQRNNPPPAAVLSRPFYLAHRVAVLKIKSPGRPEPEPWKPGDPVKPPFTEELMPPRIEMPSLDADFYYYRVVNRWLYVFQLRGDKWTWAGEYWIDAEGKHHPVDMKLAQGKERHQRPKPSKDGIPLLSLPYQINGKQVFNGFFLSGTRLPLKSIQRLEKEKWVKGELWYDLDKYDLDPTLYNGAEYIKDRAGQSFLRVKDQLWYTISLNQIMKQLRDMAIGWITPTDADQQTRSFTADRARKKLLTETIIRLLDNDPKDKLDLRDDLNPHPRLNYAAGAEEVMRQWLRDYDTTVAWWMKTVDEATRQLILELNSRVMDFITETYRSLEKIDPKGYEHDMPLFQREWSECIDRITETPRGGIWIDRVIKDNNHWIHEYLLRDSAPEGVRFQVMRKSTGALLSIWSELPTRYLLIHGKQSVKKFIETLNYTSLGTLIQDRARVTAFNLIIPGTTPVETALHWQVAADGWTSTNRRLIKLEVVAEDIKMIPDPKVEKATIVANKVFLAVELINLMIGVQTLMEKGSGGNGKGEIAWAAIGVLGSSLDATTALGALKGWKKGTLMKIGGISAVIDTILAVREAGQYKDVGDIGAAVGSGFVASGSALIATGYAMSLFGTGTAWTGAGLAAGIVGAVLVAVGYIITLFTASSPLELFVSHSLWGDKYGNDSGSKPWSAGSFMGWHESRADGLANQVAAMTNLLSTFTVSGMRWKVRIDFSMLHEKTKVHVKLATNFMDERQETQVVVDLANRRTRAIDSNQQERLDTGGTSPIYGFEYVELEMNFRDRSMQLPPNQRQLFENDHEMDCWVRLDYYGDGRKMIPASGKWVPYRTKALAKAKSSSSADY